MLSFGVKGGREAGEKFLKALELTSLVVHVGDVRTSVLHPASSTPQADVFGRSDKCRNKTGTYKGFRGDRGYRRYKKEDFDQALKKI